MDLVSLISDTVTACLHKLDIAHGASFLRLRLEAYGVTGNSHYYHIYIVEWLPEADAYRVLYRRGPKIYRTFRTLRGSEMSLVEDYDTIAVDKNCANEELLCDPAGLVEFLIYHMSNCIPTPLRVISDPWYIKAVFVLHPDDYFVMYPAKVYGETDVLTLSRTGALLFGPTFGASEGRTIQEEIAARLLLVRSVLASNTSFAT
jgi:hypothetical protein